MPHSHSKLLGMVEILNTNKKFIYRNQKYGDRLIDKDWIYAI